MYNAIEANTNVNFKVIINPNSGPGGAAGTFPDKNYITGISKLNGYKNTDLLGYVDTAYAQRKYTAATADVDAYYGWSKYTKADIHMDGIFFDDNPNSDATSPYNYLTNITKYTRTKMGKSAHISLNPGTYVSDKWYSIADSIVAFEDSYKNFKDTSTGTVKTAAQKAKSVFIVHSFGGSVTDQQTLVNKIHKTGSIAGSFVTSASNYDSWSKNFAQYVKNVASLQGKTSKRDEEVENDATEVELEKRASVSTSTAKHTSTSFLKSMATKTTKATTKHTSKPTHKPTASVGSKHHEVDHKHAGHTLSSTVKPATSTTKPRSTITKTATATPTKPAGEVKHTTATPTKPVTQPTASHTTSAHPKRWHARGWIADVVAAAVPQPIAV